MVGFDWFRGRFGKLNSRSYMKHLMSTGHKFLVTVGLGFFAPVFGAFAVSSELVALHGHVPAAVAHLTASGRLPATNSLNLAIGLPLRNQAAMSVLMQQIYDPTSTNYHKFLTPQEFTEQFGPTTNDYQAVLDFARTNGLTVTHIHGNRMLVDVSGPAANVQSSFHLNLNVYHHPTESRDFYAPDSEPTVSTNLAVLHVQGLNNYLLPHPLLKKVAATAKPANGSAPFGGYMGNDFRKAYIPGSNLNGANQIVGLLQFDGYLPSDIATYENLAGLTNVPLQNVLLDGFNGQAGGNNDEVCLDIETAISMAPALAKVVVFEAGPFGNPDDILNSMASSNSIKQFSASWAYATDATSDQIYQELALQGQTFLNASGDGDAWLGGIPFGACENPYLTLVGGTTLTMNGAAISYSSEQAWNWGLSGPNAFNPDGYWGTSGGISTDVAIPSWQTGISMANNHGSTTFRNSPDVALTADNVFVVSSGGSQSLVGGTSCASPLWAGFMALINQQAAAQGRSSVGFLAPQVYAIAKSTNYAACFHDIILGDNTWDQSPTNFFAVPGYDLCTGLGTPNGTNLVNTLVAGLTIVNSNTVTIVSAPPTPYGTTLANLNGGSPNGVWYLFVQDENQYNTGMISNGWSITLTMGSPLGPVADPGLGLTASTGTAGPGGTVVYYLNVTNYGGFSTASNVVVQDSLPIGSTYVSTSTSRGSNSITGDLLSGYHVKWNLGNLVTNDGANLAITIKAPTSLGTVQNYAFLTSDTPDVNSDDNIATLPLVVGNITVPTLGASFNNANGQFVLSVGGTGAVIIQATTNLANSSSWISVSTNTAPFSFTNFNTKSPRNLFYRVVTAP